MASKELRVEREHTLLPFLFEQLPYLKRGEVKRLLRFGSVFVNGLKATRHDKPLQPGDEVRVDRDAAKASAAKAAPGFDIVYEDEDLLVVDKPAGLLSVATLGEAVRTVHHDLTEYIQARTGNRRDRAFVVHRLDRETSGLIMFSRSAEVRERLQDHWTEIDKRYYAVVEGLPKRDEGVVRSRLAEDVTLRVRSVRPDAEGKDAVTRYKVLRRGKRRALLEVKLETGRKNQIRVHMADIGHPVVGDAKYGRASGPGGRLGLHAYRLAFTHPTTGKPLVFETPLPPALERMLA